MRESFIGEPSGVEELLALQRRAREAAGEAEREVPTLAELLALASVLPAEEAADLLAGVGSGGRPSPRTNQPPPPPRYLSWEDFLARADPATLLSWCRSKAHKANRSRLMSGSPEDRITAGDVWAVLAGARGKCEHCGSLALENRPSKPSGAPAPWEAVGRRIGSLGHRMSRFGGGANTRSNLVWSCLWCNTWPDQRIDGATDHGGYFPTTSAEI
jgi:hypothetical protein